MVRQWKDTCVIQYTDDYVLDHSYTYVTYGQHHQKYGFNLGDWFNTLLYHFSINLHNKYPYVKCIICVDESCLTLAKLFYMAFENISYVLVTKSQEELSPLIEIYTNTKHLNNGIVAHSSQEYCDAYTELYDWGNAHVINFEIDRWHDLHYNIKYLLLLCNDNGKLKFIYHGVTCNRGAKQTKIRRMRLSDGLQKLQKAKDMLLSSDTMTRTETFNNTICVYPDRGDTEQSLLKYSVLDTYYKETKENNNKILIHFKKNLVSDEEYINKRLDTPYCIENRDIIKVHSFSLDEILRFSNNKNNTLVMNRCGLLEILYWLNSKCALHCVHPPNFNKFKFYDGNVDRYTYEKLEADNITTHIKEIVINENED